MKLLPLPPLATLLLLLVSLTSSRLLRFNAMPRMGSNAIRFAAGHQPMSVIEGESSNAEVGENNYNPGMGGAVFNVPLMRSLKPQYVPILVAGESGYQPEADALPWTTY